MRARNELCACGHEAWWHWGNAGPCHESPCDCGVFAAAAEGEKP